MVCCLISPLDGSYVPGVKPTRLVSLSSSSLIIVVWTDCLSVCPVRKPASFTSCCSCCDNCPSVPPHTKEDCSTMLFGHIVTPLCWPRLVTHQTIPNGGGEESTSPPPVSQEFGGGWLPSLRLVYRVFLMSSSLSTKSLSMMPGWV